MPFENLVQQIWEQSDIFEGNPTVREIGNPPGMPKRAQGKSVECCPMLICAEQEFDAGLKKWASIPICVNERNLGSSAEFVGEIRRKQAAKEEISAPGLVAGGLRDPSDAP